MFTKPYSATVLGALVTLVFVDCGLLAHIPHAQLLVARGGDKHGAVGAPRQRLHNVGVLDGDGGLAGLDIPELDRQVAGGRGENVFGGGVEEDMADLSVFV